MICVGCTHTFREPDAVRIVEDDPIVKKIYYTKKGIVHQAAGVETVDGPTCPKCWTEKKKAMKMMEAQ